jgi:C-8 sterol isomerase
MKYVFDPEVVHECALKCLGKPKPEMFEVFADAMEERYPGWIDRSQPWLYSIAGGAMIQMKLYHVSLFEYIMIWGTPIGSEGHSGRHLVGFWDTVIDGETWYYREGIFEKQVYKPGDRIWVGPKQTAGMNFTDGVWAVEYARGLIPASMPFGLSDVLISTVDLPTAVQTASQYAYFLGKCMGKKAEGLPLPLRLPVQVGASALSAAGDWVTRACQPPPFTPEIPRG